MRLFLAINLPTEVQNQVAALYLPEIESLRWTPLHQLHITLSYLGELSPNKIDAIIEAIAELTFKPITLTLKDTGFFKSGIYWLGVDENPELINLQNRLCHAMREIGIRLEKRRFKPHVTIARTKQISAPIAQRIEQQSFGFHLEFSTDRFELMSSYLKSDGPEYQSEAEFIP